MALGSFWDSAALYVRDGLLYVVDCASRRCVLGNALLKERPTVTDASIVNKRDKDCITPA